VEKADAAPYATLAMNGTTIIEAAIATALIIITSLYRHGNFFVQRFVFSKIDIFNTPYIYCTAVRNAWT